MKAFILGALLVFVMLLTSCGRAETTVYRHGEAFVVNTSQGTVLHNGIVYEFTVSRGVVTVVFPDGTSATRFELSRQNRFDENSFFVRNLISAVEEVVNASGGVSPVFRVAPIIFFGITIALSIWEIISPFVKQEHTRKTKRRQISGVALLVISVILLVTLIGLMF